MTALHTTASGRYAVTHEDDGQYRVTDTATWRSTALDFWSEAIALAEWAEALNLPVETRSAAA